MGSASVEAARSSLAKRRPRAGWHAVGAAGAPRRSRRPARTGGRSCGRSRRRRHSSAASSSVVRPAHGQDRGRPGTTARRPAMKAMPASTSGRRGSTMTTSGRVVERELEGRPGVPGAADDDHPVADGQQPRQALADTVVRIDDEHAERARRRRDRGRHGADGGAAPRCARNGPRRVPARPNDGAAYVIRRGWTPTRSAARAGASAAAGPARSGDGRRPARRPRWSCPCPACSCT